MSRKYVKLGASNHGRIKGHVCRHRVCNCAFPSCCNDRLFDVERGASSETSVFKLDVTDVCFDAYM